MSGDREPGWDVTQPTIVEWLNQALDLWITYGVDRRGGGFFEALTLDLEPPPLPRRARVVARQIYVFSLAAQRGWRPDALAPAADGVAELQGVFLRPDGLIRRAAWRGGGEIDDRPALYEQAFALFSLAWAARTQPHGADLLPMARRLAEGLTATRRLPSGAFTEIVGDHPVQANPHMHLFEACLTLEEADPSGPWSRLADDIAELALRAFIDPRSGAVREFFDAEVRPAANDWGRILEPGHQFEWAWLMDRWAERRDSAEGFAAAERLYRAGQRGIDRQRNVAFNEMFDDFRPRDLGARLWPQAERIKAALRLGRRLDPPEEAEQAVVAAVRGLARYLTPTPMGLWRDKMGLDGAFVPEPAPASSLYHIVGALDELISAGYGGLTLA